jgi:photosystem II stability/assembly factor-like uncharacterized protein
MKQIKSSVIIICFSLLGNAGWVYAQKVPAYSPSMKFSEYAKKMNAYFDSKGKKGGLYKQWKRLEWYFSTRTDAAGKVVNMQEKKQAALQQASVLKTNYLNRTSGTLGTSGNWVAVGPSSVTSTDEGIGRVNRIGFHPTNSNILYAATAGGGLWRTSNGGTSWAALTDGLPNMNLSGVVVHKTNPNILYILTGDGDGGGSNGGGDGGCCAFGKYSTGVLKSSDGGITWNYTGLKWAETQNIAPFALVMHPSNFNILMAATNDGIWRTTNGGTTWTEVLLNETVYDIEFMPNNSSIVYASANGGRFFRSMDGGATWTNLYDNSNSRASRTSIAVTPDYATGVYMLISNSEDKDDPEPAFNGLYFSANNGDTWTLKSSGNPNVFSGDGVDTYASQQGYDHALAVSPFDEKDLITGGVRLFRSTNSGTTMSFQNNSGLAKYHVDIHELVYTPLGSTLYAATDGGVYKSADDGVTWAPINGNMAITQYYRISVSNASTSYVLGGAQDNGTHLRNTNSTTFERVVGSDGMDNAISVSNGAVMYASTQGGNFYVSSNSGNSFSFFTDDATLNAQGSWVTPIDVSTTSPYEIYIGYYPLQKGVKGVVWNFDDIGYTGFGNAKVSGRSFVKVAPGNTDIIFAGDNRYNWSGFEDAQLYWRTTDGGTNWLRMFPGGADNPLITDLAMNPDNPNEVWVTAGNYVAGRKVYRSTNGGQTWTNISGSLPNIPINCILYDDNNGNPDDALYIGTDIGVFYRDNTLGDWIPFSTNLPVVEITDLEKNEAAGLLRASTYGRGVWETADYASVCITSHNFATNAHPPSEPRFYNASTTITSIAEITGAGAHIQYKAGDRVTLNVGFRIDANTGAKFIGYLGNCNGGGVPPTYRQSFNGLNGYLND